MPLNEQTIIWCVNAWLSHVLTCQSSVNNIRIELRHNITVTFWWDCSSMNVCSIHYAIIPLFKIQRRDIFCHLLPFQLTSVNNVEPSCTPLPPSFHLFSTPYLPASPGRDGKIPLMSFSIPETTNKPFPVHWCHTRYDWRRFHFDLTLFKYWKTSTSTRDNKYAMNCGWLSNHFI